MAEETEYEEPPTLEGLFINYFIYRLREEADRNLAVARNLERAINSQLLLECTTEPEFIYEPKLICRLAKIYRVKTVGLRSSIKIGSRTMDSHELMTYLSVEAHNICSRGLLWPNICYVIELVGQAIVESAASISTVNRCNLLLQWIVSFFYHPYFNGTSIQDIIDTKLGGWNMSLTAAEWDREGSLALKCEEQDDNTTPYEKRGSIYHCCNAMCSYTSPYRESAKTHYLHHHPYTSGLLNNCSCGARKIRGGETSAICFRCGTIQCLVEDCRYENSVSNCRHFMKHFEYHERIPDNMEIFRGHICSCGNEPFTNGMWKTTSCGSHACSTCGSKYLKKRKRICRDSII